MKHNERPTHLDIFSGIGGFALAAEWAGFRTIAHAEIDGFASGILRQHWPAIPNLGDVRNIYRFADEYPLCDCCDEPYCQRHGKHYADCSSQVGNARDWKDTPGMTGIRASTQKERRDQTARRIFGHMRDRNETPSSGTRLNPQFVLWLMGFQPNYFASN